MFSKGAQKSYDVARFGVQGNQNGRKLFEKQDFSFLTYF